MNEITFRYDPEHLKTYQRLASHRVEVKSTDYVARWWRWMLLYTLLAGALLASAYLALPELTGRPSPCWNSPAASSGEWPSASR
jgi:hypothetical protein